MHALVLFDRVGNPSKTPSLSKCAATATALHESTLYGWISGDGTGLEIGFDLPEAYPKPQFGVARQPPKEWREQLKEKAQVTLKRYTKSSGYKSLVLTNTEQNIISRDAEMVFRILLSKYALLAIPRGLILEEYGWPRFVTKNLINYARANKPPEWLFEGATRDDLDADLVRVQDVVRFAFKLPA